jgi:hypothetical protein
MPDSVTNLPMNARGSRLGKIIAVTALLTLAVYGLYYPFSDVALQSKNMSLARRHLPKVDAVLNQEPRFRRVKGLPYTSGNGCLGIVGYVKSDKDLNELRQII